MRPVPAAVAACLIVACVGFVAHSALPRVRSGGVALESAGDLIREAQHMKVNTLSVWRYALALLH
jgi:hypothetical protein